MADSKIRLLLQSVYDGKGMQKANEAVKGLSKNIKDATEGVRGITGELGALGGTAGKVADGVGKLFSSFAAGPIGIVIAGIGLIISAFKAWKDSAEEAARQHKEMMEKMEQGYKRRLAEAVERARQKQIDFFDAIIKKSETALDRMTKLNNSFKSLQNAKSNNYVAGFDVDNAKIDFNAEVEKRGKSDDDKRLIDAKTALAKQINNNVKKQVALDKAVDEERFNIDDINSRIKEYKTKIDAIEKKGEDASKARLELQLEEERLKQATIDLETAEKKRTAGMLEINTAAMKAQENVRKVEEDIAKKKAEAEQKRIESENKKADDERKKAEDERKKNAKQVLEAEKDAVKDAGKKRVELLQKQYNEMKSVQNRGMTSDAKHHNGLFGQYQYQLDENGNIKNFRDFQRVQRYAERDKRDNDRNDPAQQQYDRLKRRVNKGGKISDRDKKFMKEFEDFQAAKNAPQKIQDLVDQMNKKVDDIDKKLKDLGAK